MAKKTNPNKIPRTEADCKRALTEGIEIGTKHALKMALYILLDKHGAPAEDVQQLSEELTWLARKLAKGDTKEGLSWSFVDQVLRENHVEVRLR